MVQTEKDSCADQPTAPALSVVIPFFNEEASIGPLFAELRETFASMGVAGEILAVDDGSTDGTRRELEAIAQKWPVLRVCHLPQHEGQAAALCFGFRAARGTWIAMLDGDGQNPPFELARLWDLRDSADMIVGARALRRDSALRRIMSRVANVVRRWALRDMVTDSGCSLKLFRREVVRSFVPIRTMYSFLPAFAISGGWTLREIAVSHRPRRTGNSKYGLRVMAMHPFLDLLALCWILRRTVRQKDTPNACPDLTDSGLDNKYKEP